MASSHPPSPRLEFRAWLAEVEGRVELVTLALPHWFSTKFNGAV